MNLFKLFISSTIYPLNIYVRYFFPYVSVHPTSLVQIVTNTVKPNASFKKIIIFDNYLFLSALNNVTCVIFFSIRKCLYNFFSRYKLNKVKTNALFK